jgi:hypothetical protein
MRRQISEATGQTVFKFRFTFYLLELPLVFVQSSLLAGEGQTRRRYPVEFSGQPRLRKSVFAIPVANRITPNHFFGRQNRDMVEIVRDVLIALSARCQAEVAPALPPGTTVVLSNTTTFNQSLTTTISLLIEANTITSVSVALQNVQFQIVGFASVIVQVSGEAVVTVVYQGIDGLPHTQTVTVPFVFTEIVPGTFPANSAVQGNLAIINQTVENIIDPSTLAITAVIVTLFFATNIIIVAPVA